MTNYSAYNELLTPSLERFLPYRLSALAETVSRAVAQHYEQHCGITIPGWRVIAVLGERSPQSTQEIVERTGMARVKVSRAAIPLRGWSRGRRADGSSAGRPPSLGAKLVHWQNTARIGDENGHLCARDRSTSA
jgi:hypothetical protein